MFSFTFWILLILCTGPYYKLWVFIGYILILYYLNSHIGDYTLNISQSSNLSFTFVVGNLLFLACRNLCKWKNHDRFGSDLRFVRNNSSLQKNIKSRKRYSSKINSASISCSNNVGNDSNGFSTAQLNEAKVIYCVAPAMGHNQV